MNKSLHDQLYDELLKTNIDAPLAIALVRLTHASAMMTLSKDCSCDISKIAFMKCEKCKLGNALELLNKEIWIKREERKLEAIRGKLPPIEFLPDPNMPKDQWRIIDPTTIPDIQDRKIIDALKEEIKKTK